MIRATSRETPERGSAAVAKRLDALDSVPLVLLTRGNSFPGPDTAQNRRMWEHWVALSGQLAHRSSRGEQVVVPKTGHFIQYAAPQAVVDAVERVLVIANAPAKH
jgi:pimeloyl-ACP methyl ester carboxylesterase